MRKTWFKILAFIRFVYSGIECKNEEYMVWKICEQLCVKGTKDLVIYR